MLDIAGSARVFTAASELAACSGDALPYEVQVVASEDARIRVTSALPGRGAMRAAADDKLWDWPRTRAAAAARRDASRRVGLYGRAFTARHWSAETRHASIHFAARCNPQIQQRHARKPLRPQGIFYNSINVVL